MFCGLWRRQPANVFPNRNHFGCIFYNQARLLCGIYLQVPCGRVAPLCWGRIAPVYVRNWHNTVHCLDLVKSEA